jgi:hypothetical protein
MKPSFSFARAALSTMAVAFVSLLFAGCATTKKADWNSRIGNFTYDQAVAELGPPDKSAKLSDGSSVAEWIWRRSGGGAFSIGTGVYGRHTAVAVGQTIGSGYGERILRLTFGPDGKLTGWNQQSR